jgi:hypothetical protein
MVLVILTAKQSVAMKQKTMKKGFYYGLWLSIGLFLAAVSLLFPMGEIQRRTGEAVVALLPGSESEHIRSTPRTMSDTIATSETITTRSSNPLKIFVMVGQSNMVGHGYMDMKDDTTGKFLNGTLEWMVETYPETYGKLKTYNKGSGESVSWKARDDVMISYNRQFVKNVRPESKQHGPLVAGFGGDGGNKGHDMGPELSFGWTVGDALKEDNPNEGSDKSRIEIDEQSVTAVTTNILLIKVAWGGRSLAVDYRPPLSGGTTGLYYEAMMANIYKTLANLSELVPGYTSTRGYELAGFAWHQGWNDGCDVNMTAEYESNLANLIRDVRTDLGVPDVPISIGVSGMNGWHPDSSKRNDIVNAQLAVANATKYPEFEGTVASVETRDFYRDKIPVSPGDQIYHWNNNCESYWLIGQAMGEAMIDLIRNNKNKKRRTTK